jgi:hypothetical protein
MKRIPWALAALVVAAATGSAPAVPAQTPATRGRQFLKAVAGFTPADFAALDAGKPVTHPIETKEKSEVGAVGAIDVSAEPAALFDAARDFVKLRRVPEILEIGLFSDPPKVEDLAGLTFSDDDWDALRRCKPGKCDVKLGPAIIDRLGREIAWTAPNAREKAVDLAKEEMVAYVRAYQAGGTTAMGAIVDKANPRSRVDEFAALLAHSPYFVEYVPEFFDYLRDFPRGRLAGARDIFYWTRDNFGLKPTVSMYHVTIRQEGKEALMAQKLIYASHYFNAGLETWAVTDTPTGKGFELILLYRARLDPPTGMLSGMLMGKVRDGIESGVRANLQAGKVKAEKR